MATLEKIRKRGVLLLVFVGTALLAFVVGDFLNSSNTFFGESRTNIIEVGGEAVKIDDFQADVEGLKQIYLMQMNQSQLAEGMEEQVRQSVFESIVREKLITSQTEKLGISVSSKELFDLIGGENTHPAIQSLPLFRDPETGMFNKKYLLQFINNLNMDTRNLVPQQMEELNKYKSLWLYIENFVKNSKLEEKYTNLLYSTFNVNSLDAKFAFEAAKNTADVKYIVKPYSSIADSTIFVSDKELKAEYKLKKERFKQDYSRDIKFISFMIKPSADDFAKILDQITRQKPEFVSLADVSDLVNDNSDIAYPIFHVSEANIDADLKEFAFSAKKDSVQGPLLFGDTYKMARIIDRDIAPDSVSIRHILLMNADDEKNKTLSDSILTALRGGADFAALAQKYSANQNTAQKGGEVGWVREEMLEKEMIAPAFYKTDKLFSVKTNNGLQIVEIQDRTKPVAKVKLAVIERKVVASNNTFSFIYNEAKNYVVHNNTVEKFENGAQDKGYVVRSANLTENTPNINGISNSRQVVRWAFDNDGNVISDVLTCGDEFIVAALTKINKKGYKPLDDVKDELKTSLIRDKKAEIISKQLTQELQSNSSMESLARALSLPVDTLAGVNFSGSRTAIGNEPVILATASFIQVNELSAPLQGNNGVYVILPYNINTSKAEYDESMQRILLNNQSRYSRNPQSVIDILKETEGVEDNRFRFY